jgi:hypothetical protein
VGQTDFLSLVDSVDEVHVDGQDWTSEDDEEDDDWGLDPDDEGASEMELDIEVNLEVDMDTETDGETEGEVETGLGSDSDGEIFEGFGEQ